jgi:hypothetical protein
MIMEDSTSKPAMAATDSTGGPSPGTPAPATEGAAPLRLSAKYLADKLDEAELLLGYAAEVGIAVADEVRDGVIKARSASDRGGITETTADALLTALTTLATKVKPVTVESLRSCANPKEARKPIRLYGTLAMIIGCVIVIFSLLTFVSKSISDKITADVESANVLVAKLRTELGPPPTDPPATNPAPGNLAASVSLQDRIWYGPDGIPAGLSDKDVISDLQQFAAAMREIDGYTRQLKPCLLDFSAHQYHYTIGQTNQSPLELKPGLNVRLSQELTDKVMEYQQVRSFGNQVVERVTVYYGAIAISILPVLYALLGAVAYLLRNYEDQFKNRVLIAGDKHLARLMVAGIGGLVAGQFNNVTQGVSISPFAVAFLVGYAVDVFFTFLEGLLQMFKK